MAVNGKDLGSRLDQAAEICEQQGVRFTELRRDILCLILAVNGPVGAYDLLDKLKQTRKGVAPPTIYRALDFLRAQGLIHRVECLNAFMPSVGIVTLTLNGQPPTERRHGVPIMLPAGRTSPDARF